MSRYRSIQKRLAVRGAELSREAAGSIVTIEPPQLAWLVRIAVPFSYAASKNHVWTTKDRDTVRSRARKQAFRQRITEIFCTALAGRRVAINKLWIDIRVQKPNHKGDAVNVVDLVCDAVKDATGLDDRWYSLRSVDWEIVKGEPMLFIGIGQEAVEDVQACSSCGRLLPFAMFASNRSNKHGHGRNCNDCRRTAR